MQLASHLGIPFNKKPTNVIGYPLIRNGTVLRGHIMRTFENKLSLWNVSAEEEEKLIAEAALALVSSPDQKDLETIVILLLHPTELESEKLEIRQQDEKTLVKDFAHSHWNILDLTYAKLGAMAKIILGKIHEGKSTRVRRSAIIEIIIEALKQKRLEFDGLSDKIQAIVVKRCRARGEDLDHFVK